MNKKVLSLVLALAIVLGSFGTVALASNTEVAYNSQAQKIQWLIDNNHVEGRKVNADGSADLALEDNVTRAEITKLLVHLLGKADLADVLKGVMRPFPDVTIEHWANGYVSVATTTRANAANENRIVIGFPDGKFYPENNVTYAELATMLVRIAKDDLTTKMEADSIWATSYMRWADEEGILEGLTITNSDKAITRADAFEMIYNTFFKMGSVNEVNFGDDLGIVSRLGNGEIQLNQDAKRVYKIDSNTLLTDGTTWKSLLDNIDAPLRGSLVRLIVDKDGRVSHLIELGNPRDLALGRDVNETGFHLTPNVRWHGVARNTVEARENSYFVVDATNRYVDIRVNGVNAEIVNSTRFFVADVHNNALQEVDSVTEAFSLLGIRTANPKEVYMGYDVVDGVNEARVIVFNKVDNYFGEKDIVRITGDLNSLYRFEAENTKGVKRAYDVSNLPLFPSNDLLDPMDVVEITDNTNVQYARKLIKIDYSDAPVYKVDDVQSRSIKLVDKDGFARTYPLSRDLLTFLEGQLVKGAHVQLAFNEANTEIEIVSVVNRDLKGILKDGVRIGEDRGFIVNVETVNGRTQVVVADRRTDGQLVNHRTYEVEPTSVKFVTNADRTREIMFDVESKFGNTNVMYNVEYVRAQGLADEIRLATEAIVAYENNGTQTNLDAAREAVENVSNEADRNELSTRLENAVALRQAELAIADLKIENGAGQVLDQTTVQLTQDFKMVGMKEGYTYAFTSSEPVAVNVDAQGDGEVNQLTEETVVTLTATITSETNPAGTATKVFTITVPAQGPIEEVDEELEEATELVKAAEDVNPIAANSTAINAAQALLDEAAEAVGVLEDSEEKTALGERIEAQQELIDAANLQRLKNNAEYHVSRFEENPTDETLAANAQAAIDALPEGEIADDFQTRYDEAVAAAEEEAAITIGENEKFSQLAAKVYHDNRYPDAPDMHADMINVFFSTDKEAKSITGTAKAGDVEITLLYQGDLEAGDHLLEDGYAFIDADKSHTTEEEWLAFAEAYFADEESGEVTIIVTDMMGNETTETLSIINAIAK